MTDNEDGVTVYRWEGNRENFPMDLMVLGPGWRLHWWLDGTFSAKSDTDAEGGRYGQGHPYFRRIA